MSHRLLTKLGPKAQLFVLLLLAAGLQFAVADRTITTQEPPKQESLFVPGMDPLNFDFTDPLEAEVRSALDRIFGPANFDLHLVLTRRTTHQTQVSTQLGEPVLVAEQVKEESMDPRLSPQNVDPQGSYTYRITSRNWDTSSKVKTNNEYWTTEVISVRCVVYLDKGDWSKVDKAHQVLSCLLDINPIRGDRLLFVER